MGVVLIARCPEHGLHGERTACFVCGGPVEQVPLVPVLPTPSIVARIADQLSAMDGLDRADRYVEVIRVAKVFEEAGEAMQALIGYHDVNPRKQPGSLAEVIKELCDVALSAKIAIESFGRDAEDELAAREVAVLERLRAAGGEV